MKAKIVGIGKDKVIIMDVEKLPKHLIKGYTEDLTEVRKQGGLCHREELDNQPILEGFAGPMWDGDMLRYETWEMYDLLSR